GAASARAVSAIRGLHGARPGAAAALERRERSRAVSSFSLSQEPGVSSLGRLLGGAGAPCLESTVGYSNRRACHICWFTLPETPPQSWPSRGKLIGVISERYELMMQVKGPGR